MPDTGRKSIGSDSMKNWIKRYKKEFLIGTLLIIALPVVLNYLIFSWRAPGVNGDWMGFLGSYLGAIIGVIVVYITARMQLNSQKVENRENKVFQVRPYLRAEIPMRQEVTEKISFLPISPSDDYIPPDLANNYGKGEFLLANIGLGTAIDINFTVKQFMHKYSVNNSALLVKEEANFSLFTFLHTIDKFILTVSYNDMLGNSYSQDIQFSSTFISDSEGYKLEVTRTYPPKLN